MSTPKAPETAEQDSGPEEAEYQAQLAVALAAQLVRQQADSRLPDRLLANARQYARASGVEIVDVTPVSGGAADPCAGLENSKLLHFLRRTPATEAHFACRAPPSIRRGQFTFVAAPPVALLFRLAADGSQRYLTIPSEAAFTEEVFGKFCCE